MPKNQENEIVTHLFANLPIEQFGRFFIDGKKQNDPRSLLVFDKDEPGYLNSCLTAFFDICQNIDEPVTPDLLKRIHNQAIGSLGGRTFAAVKVGEFTTGQSFGLVYDQNQSRNSSKKGLKEIFEMQKDVGFLVINRGAGNEIVTYLAPEIIKNKVNEIIDKYNKKIAELEQNLRESLDDSKKKELKENKLIAIVELVQKLERLHPFGDGNCRTFCMLLLNKELMRNGFFPSNLTDPNCFDGFSNSEMVEEILRGQLRYIKLCSGEPTIIYDIAGLDKDGKEITEQLLVDTKLESHDKYSILINTLIALTKSNQNNIPDGLKKLLDDKLNIFVGDIDTSQIYKDHYNFIKFIMGQLYKDGEPNFDKKVNGAVFSALSKLLMTIGSKVTTNVDKEFTVYDIQLFIEEMIENYFTKDSEPIIPLLLICVDEYCKNLNITDDNCQSCYNSLNSLITCINNELSGTSKEHSTLVQVLDKLAVQLETCDKKIKENKKQGASYP